MKRSSDPRQLEMELPQRHRADYIPIGSPQLEMRLIQAPPAHEPWRWPKGYNARPPRHPGERYPCGERVKTYEESSRDFTIRILIDRAEWAMRHNRFFLMPWVTKIEKK